MVAVAVTGIALGVTRKGLVVGVKVGTGKVGKGLAEGDAVAVGVRVGVAEGATMFTGKLVPMSLPKLGSVQAVSAAVTETPEATVVAVIGITICWVAFAAIEPLAIVHVTTVAAVTQVKLPEKVADPTVKADGTAMVRVMGRSVVGAAVRLVSTTVTVPLAFCTNVVDP
jgi:hypothetical protein